MVSDIVSDRFLRFRCFSIKIKKSFLCQLDNNFNQGLLESSNLTAGTTSINVRIDKILVINNNCNKSLTVYHKVIISSRDKNLKCIK